MRVISGIYKGTILAAPEGLDTRPTKEMVREALFSSLGNIHEKKFLDLFAGSGAMGIEALSRGAFSFFNDQETKACQVIRQNLQKIACEEFLLTQQDALQYVRDSRENFDIIFCDPPYHYDKKEELLLLIQQRQLLRKKGYLIYEESSRSPLQEKIGQFCLVKTKKYGLSRTVFYQECEE